MAYLVHQTLSANRAGTMFDACGQNVPPRAVAVHTTLDSL